MDAIGIAEQKLIDALEEARLEARDGTRPQGALTTAELSEKLSVSEKTVRRFLGMLKKLGKIEKTEIWGQDLAERQIPFPAYRLIDGVEGLDNKEDETP